MFKIPVDGGAPVLLVKEYSIDPIWAPSGRFLVYTGADVGTNFTVKAVGTDGTPYELPTLILSRGARRLAFLNGDDALVIMKGGISHVVKSSLIGHKKSRISFCSTCPIGEARRPPPGGRGAAGRTSVWTLPTAWRGRALSTAGLRIP